MVEDHLGMKADSTKHINFAFAIEPQLPPIVFVNRAVIELNQGDHDQALVNVNRAISIDPYLKEAYQVRSEIEKKAGDAAKAAADSERANKLVPHLDV
jgi:tetratricopeptide (TPR) repeat protein